MDRRSKKAALFFVACDANPDTRVKIPDAMRIKGYSPSKAADRSLQMQVCCKADKMKGDAIPGPPAPAAAAASALLTLSTTANVGRPLLRTITTVLVAVSNLDAWFDNFRSFLIEFDFAGVRDDGEPTYTKAQLRQIMNVDETEISLDASNTRAGGRPAVSCRFTIPTFRQQAGPRQNRRLPAQEYLVAALQASVYVRTSSCQRARRPRRGRRSDSSF